MQSALFEIFDLYHKLGNEQYGENVTQLQHALQSAKLAEEAGYDEEVILAAFLHDIGHLSAISNPHERMGEFGVVSHEKLGSQFLLERGFSTKVAALVEGHVAAKRYLTFKDPIYYERLSEASKNTLRYQGGPMTEEEARLFEQNPYFELSLLMRNWDDEAKIPDLPPEDFSRYVEMAERHMSLKN